MRLVIDAPCARDGEDMALELERIKDLIDQDFTSGEVRGGWWRLDGEWADEVEEYPDFQVRHDHLGWYICTNEEAEHEDEGNPSVGFDGREHYDSQELACEALQEIAA